MVEFVNGAWSSNWATIDTTVGQGEGMFAWPFYEGAITFTTYGDIDLGENYTYTGTAKYKLNDKESFNVTGAGDWMALANPYPAKLSVSKFVAANTNTNTNIASGTEGNIQGQCIYKLTKNISNNKQTWDVVFANTNETVKDIEIAEGFFVNLASGNQVTFSKTQLTNYPTPQQKSQVAQREFVELSLVKGKLNSKLYFAHNQEAEQNYDIFDANKLFAIGEVAEPYFVTEGIALVKEEVAELPYYATMNVRSFANDTVSFVVNNIPEGLAVSIIDGEEVIDLVEGGVYSTEILTGENADRFKVLVKKNVGLADVEELDVTIINSNRHISITAQEDVKVTVYNTLGQRVFETEKTDFVLSGVASGAYVVKVQGAKAAKSQKIIVE